MPDPENYCGQRRYRQVVQPPFVIAGSHGPELLQAVDTALHLVAEGIQRPVKTRGASAPAPLLLPSFALVFPLGNDVRKLPLVQELPAAGITVAAIQAQHGRSFPRATTLASLGVKLSVICGERAEFVPYPSLVLAMDAASVDQGDGGDLHFMSIDLKDKSHARSVTRLGE